MKKTKQYWVRAFTAAALLIALIWFVEGCNGVQKAVGKVMANDDAFNQVGAKWAKQNPCANDSVIIVKSDTVTHADTTYADVVLFKDNAIKPSLFFAQSDSNTAINMPHPATIKTITVVKIVHDSTKVIVVDTRALNMALDSLNNTRLQFANYKAAATAQIDDWKSKAHTRLWLLIGIIVLEVIIAVILIYIKHI